MKLICISRGSKLFESQYQGGFWYDQFKEFTLGKIYDILPIDNDYFYDHNNYFHVADDNNHQRYIHKDLHLFMELNENRRKKLQKLLK